jgi:chemotaxis protein MotB
MSKKKHPEHVNHERWLVSYADFITLLFAFFVVLFASSQSDRKKAAKVGQAISAAFSQGIFDAHTKTPALTDDSGAPPDTNPSPIALALPTSPQMAQQLAQQLAQQAAQQAAIAAKTKKDIEQILDENIAKHILSATNVDLHMSDAGLVISLREGGFFGSGSSEIRPEALPVIYAIANALPHQPMRVEGHTDNVAMHSSQFPSNWELSTARAATITRILIQRGIVEPSEISAAGYAEFHPIADNATEDGRRQNRRVDIILLKPAAPVTAEQLKAAATAAAFPEPKKPEPAKPEPAKTTSAPPSFLPPVPKPSRSPVSTAAHQIPHKKPAARYPNPAFPSSPAESSRGAAAKP